MKPRVAVIGAGSFGRNHLRVIHQSENAELAGVLDSDPSRAEAAAIANNCRRFSSIDEVADHADAAVVATPTVSHAELGCSLMEKGIDVLIEKPIADSPAAARELVATAKRTGRILQVGHLERFNPAVMALAKAIKTPLFFEIHRLSEFSPRSLDVDVVLDLMIHDIDIVLALTGQTPQEIQAAGIRILSQKVDIANVRLQFASRLHREPDGQPRLHRACPQAAALSAARIYLARLQPAGGRALPGEAAYGYRFRSAHECAHGPTPWPTHGPKSRATQTGAGELLRKRRHAPRPRGDWRAGLSGAGGCAGDSGPD